MPGCMDEPTSNLFLGKPTVDRRPTWDDGAAPDPEQLRRVGRYRLIEPLGEGDIVGGIRFMAEALDSYESGGASPRKRLRCYSRLGEWSRQVDLSSAVEYLARAYEIGAELPDNDRDKLRVMSLLASALQAQDGFEDALAIRQRLIDIHNSASGATHFVSLFDRAAVIELLLLLDRPAEALRTSRNWASLFSRELGSDSSISRRLRSEMVEAAARAIRARGRKPSERPAALTELADALRRMIDWKTSDDDLREAMRFLTEFGPPGSS